MNRIERIPPTPPPLAAMGLENFVPYLLNRVTARWNAELAAPMKAHGLNVVQMRTLAVLSILSGATVNELAVHAVTEQSTMSRTLDAMQEEGLVRRLPRDGDMRVREVHVTARGRALFERFWPAMHDALGQMTGGLTHAEYATLVSLLTRMLANLEREESL